MDSLFNWGYFNKNYLNCITSLDHAKSFKSIIIIIINCIFQLCKLVKGGKKIMKKIMLSFVLGVFLMSFVVASISGMAVSVSGNKLRTFSFNDESYSIRVSKSSDGNADLEVNGEIIESIQEGDSVVVDGAEFEVNRVRVPGLFRKRHKIYLEVKESVGPEYNGLLAQGKPLEKLKGYEVRYDENGEMVYEVIPKSERPRRSGCFGLIQDASLGGNTVNYPGIKTKEEFKLEIGKAEESKDIVGFERLLSFGVEKGYVLEGGSPSSTESDSILLGPHFIKNKDKSVSYCYCSLFLSGSCSFVLNGNTGNYYCYNNGCSFSGQPNVCSEGSFQWF